MHITNYRADEDALECFRSGRIRAGRLALLEITHYCLRSSGDAMLAYARDLWRKASEILWQQKKFEIQRVGLLWYETRLSANIGDMIATNSAADEALVILSRLLILSREYELRRLYFYGIKAYSLAYLGERRSAYRQFCEYYVLQQFGDFSDAEISHCRNITYELMTRNKLGLPATGKPHLVQAHRRRHRVRTNRKADPSW